MNNRGRTPTHRQRLHALIGLLIVGIVVVACNGPANAASDQRSHSAAILKASPSAPSFVPTATRARTPAPVRTVASSDDTSTPADTTRQVGASCRSSEVGLDIGDRISEPTGQHTLALTLTNRSTWPCSLFGYPAVALLDAAGATLPFDYRHHGDQVVTSAPPRRVDLPPGGVAYVTLNKYRCDLSDRARVNSVQLLLPGDAMALQATLSPLAWNMSLAYCGPGDPGSIVSISPIAASFGETLAH